MDTVKSRLTVLFEAPFWVGVYERESGGRYEACKLTFGAEPKDYEVYDFMLKNWDRMRFSPAVAVASVREHRINPKRMQREIQRQTQNTGIGTRAQQAIQLQREQIKAERKSLSRLEREQEQKRRFKLSRDKKKEKRSGH